MRVVNKRWWNKLGAQHNKTRMHPNSLILFLLPQVSLIMLIAGAISHSQWETQTCKTILVKERAQRTFTHIHEPQHKSILESTPFTTTLLNKSIICPQAMGDEFITYINPHYAQCSSYMLTWTEMEMKRVSDTVIWLTNKNALIIYTLLTYPSVTLTSSPATNERRQK